MKVLFIGGVKTNNIVSAIKPKFKSGSVEIQSLIDISEVEYLFSKGEDFDRAILMEQSWTKDGAITEESKIRERLNKFISVITEKNRDCTIVFITESDKQARILGEETLNIIENSVIILKNPPYYASFFINMATNDIDTFDDKLIFRLNMIGEKSKDSDNIEWYEQEKEELEYGMGIGERLKSARDININIDVDIETDMNTENEIEYTDDNIENFDDDYGFGELSLNEEVKEPELEDNTEKIEDTTEEIEDKTENIEFNWDELENKYNDIKDIEIPESEIEESKISETEVLESIGDVGFIWNEGENKSIDIDNDSTVFKLDSNYDEELDSVELEDNYTIEDNSINDTENIKLGIHEEVKSELEKFVNEDEKNEAFNNEEAIEDKEEAIEDKEVAIEDKEVEDECNLNTEVKEALVDEELDEELNDINKIEELFEKDNNTIPVVIDEIKSEENELEDWFDSEHKNNVEDNLVEALSNRTYKEEYVKTVEHKEININRLDDRESKYKDTIEDRDKLLLSILKTFKKHGKSIVVTGAHDSGKTTIAYNLGNILVKMGLSVLIVDCDIIGRGQSYISKNSFECVHSLEAEHAGFRMAINGKPASLSRAISIINPGMHLLTMGLAADIPKWEDIKEVSNTSNFNNLVKSRYNCVIYDCNIDILDEYFAEFIYGADEIINVAMGTNKGLMDCLIHLSNLSNPEVENSMFTRSNILLNKTIPMQRLFGYKCKSIKDILPTMDKMVKELMGEDPGYYFKDIHLCGNISFNNSLEQYWMNKIQISDTEEGYKLFKDILSSVFIK